MGAAIAITVSILVVICLVAAFLGSSKQREKKARRTVAEEFKDCDGHVYTDYKVYIDGDEYMVDLIYLGKTGLYTARVILQEGEIYGDNMSKEWTRVYRGKEEKFPSPVKEREKLVNILRSVIHTDYQIYSCVVFMKADIKNVRCTNVLTLSGLKQYIKERPVMLSQNDIDAIKAQIDKYKKTGESSNV